MIKRYSSFEEVDQQLKILRLQRDISSERIKLDFNQSLTHFNFYPIRLIEGIGTALQKLVVIFALKKLRTLFGREDS
jgi:hypothetical protein